VKVRSITWSWKQSLEDRVAERHKDSLEDRKSPGRQNETLGDNKRSVEDRSSLWLTGTVFGKQKDATEDITLLEERTSLWKKEAVSDSQGFYSVKERLNTLHDLIALVRS
jgi:hypothetical protein